MATYTVKRNDNILAIARRLGVDENNLLRANPGMRTLNPGTVLAVPRSGGVQEARLTLPPPPGWSPPPAYKPPLPGIVYPPRRSPRPNPTPTIPATPVTRAVRREQSGRSPTRSIVQPTLARPQARINAPVARAAPTPYYTPYRPQPVAQPVSRTPAYRPYVPQYRPDAFVGARAGVQGRTEEEERVLSEEERRRRRATVGAVGGPLALGAQGLTVFGQPITPFMTRPAIGLAAGVNALRPGTFPNLPYAMPGQIPAMPGAAGVVGATQAAALPAAMEGAQAGAAPTSPLVEALPIVEAPQGWISGYGIGPNGELIPDSSIVDYLVQQGQLPVAFTAREVQRLGLTEQELVTAGYEPTQFGGWVRANYGAVEEQAAGGGGRGLGYYGGYGGRGGGGGGGGGGGAGYTFAGNQPQRQYTGGYNQVPYQYAAASPTGRNVNPARMGLISWRI